MKKLFLLFAFFGLFAFVANAQVCPHAHKAKTATNGQCHFSKNAAAKAASLDSDIQENVSAETGLVSYSKRDVCCKTGKVTLTSVEYSSASGTFVNVSPKGQKTCTKGYGAKATRVANKSKSHCTPAQKAACGAHGAKASANSAATNVKLVSNEDK